jgi:phosphoribosylglycinamide formyltransferase-1
LKQKFLGKSLPGLLKIAVFASGKGSNFKAILDAIKSGSIPKTEIVVVISNNSGAGALATARDEKIPAIHCSRKQFDSDEEFTSALLKRLDEHGVNFIVLAGYMKKIGAAIIRNYKNRIVNIHPALLPAFGGAGMYGMHVHEAVIKSGSKISGATVHIVDEEYDRGPIVLQRTVEVSNEDTPETLAAKVLKIEHQIYPEAIRLFAEGTVQFQHHEVTKV